MNGIDDLCPDPKGRLTRLLIWMGFFMLTSLTSVLCWEFTRSPEVLSSQSALLLKSYHGISLGRFILNVSAKLGNEDSSSRLAMLLLNESFGDLGKTREAVRLLSLLALRGDLAAQKMMAWITSQEAVCPTSIGWTKLAAMQGDRESMAQLGWAQLKGCGTSIDPVSAVHWFCKAAQKGDLAAAFAAGKLL